MYISGVSCEEPPQHLFGNFPFFSPSPLLSPFPSELLTWDPFPPSHSQLTVSMGIYSCYLWNQMLIIKERYTAAYLDCLP